MNRKRIKRELHRVDRDIRNTEAYIRFYQSELQKLKQREQELLAKEAADGE
jgi:hypothetical protein